MLNRFNDNEWSSGDREVPSSQTADGTMPGLVGVSAELTRHKYDYQLEGDPRVPLHAGCRPRSWSSRVEAPGDWRYDVSTMDFLASNDDLDTSQLNWTLRGGQGRLRREPAGGGAAGRRAGLA